MQVTNTRILRWGLNLWPPLLGTGIVIERIDPDYRRVDVRMALHWYNRNYVGTHFGGSLAAMTDPFYMLMLIGVLGKDYYVWDRRTAIDFVAPGRDTVRAHFRLDDAIIEDIRAHTANGDKYFADLSVDITDSDDNVIAAVQKTIYVRRKPRSRQLT